MKLFLTCILTLLHIAFTEEQVFHPEILFQSNGKSMWLEEDSLKSKVVSVSGPFPHLHFEQLDNYSIDVSQTEITSLSSNFFNTTAYTTKDSLYLVKKILPQTLAPSPLVGGKFSKVVNKRGLAYGFKVAPKTKLLKPYYLDNWDIITHSIKPKGSYFQIYHMGKGFPTKATVSHQLPFKIKEILWSTTTTDNKTANFHHFVFLDTRGKLYHFKFKQIHISGKFIFSKPKLLASGFKNTLSHFAINNLYKNGFFSIAFLDQKKNTLKHSLWEFRLKNNRVKILNKKSHKIPLPEKQGKFQLVNLKTISFINSNASEIYTLTESDEAIIPKYSNQWQYNQLPEGAQHLTTGAAFVSSDVGIKTIWFYQFLHPFLGWDYRKYDLFNKNQTTTLKYYKE